VGAYGISGGPDGAVYVTDGINDSVKKYSSSGALLTQWGSFGTGDGEFDTPLDVAVGPSGDVYVVDRQNNRIQQFDSDGIFIRKWGSPGGGDGQFGQPSAIAVGPSGNVYVNDGGNGRIQVFTSTGDYLRQWNVSPADIAVDADENVYVTLQGPRLVKKYSSTGSLLTQWGSYGSGDGQFASPFGIAVDSAGTVYVADTSLDRIQAFTSDGTFIAKWGSSGSGDGQFGNPVRIAIDSSGNVMVADYSNANIQVFGGGCEYTGPELETCVLDALDAMFGGTYTPGTFPEMEAALGETCDDDPGTDDELTIVTEPIPGNYKYECPESLVIAQGIEIGQNNIGSNDCSNSLFLGNGATVNGNVLKTENVWIAGTGNTITGNINHSVSLHVGPDADLHVGGSINDLQTLTVGLNGYVHVDKDMDIWVDVDNDGLVEVGRTLYCNGLASPPSNPGVINTDDDQCPVISAGPLAAAGTSWTYAAIVAILGFGMALIIRERGKKKA
jgi:DNA-binding beta-propeller fold protein YncE